MESQIAEPKVGEIGRKEKMREKGRESNTIFHNVTGWQTSRFKTITHNKQRS